MLFVGENALRIGAVLSPHLNRNRNVRVLDFNIRVSAVFCGCGLMQLRCDELRLQLQISNISCVIKIM